MIVYIIYTDKTRVLLSVSLSLFERTSFLLLLPITSQDLTGLIHCYITIHYVTAHYSIYIYIYIFVNDEIDDIEFLARVRIRSLSPSALMQHASFRLLLSYSDVRSGVMQSPVCPHSLRQALKQFEAANGAA